MPVPAALTADLKKVVLALQDDLRQRVESIPEVRDAWAAEHAAAVTRERTAMTWGAWRDDKVTQAAVAWALTTVFIRFCEDNALLKPVWLAGPSARRQEALDAELAYYRAHPEHNEREWLQQAFDYLRTVDATQALVGEHSPLWSVSPSGPAAKNLVDFWRARDDQGALVRDFSDPSLDTRFLGDLYQDLSEYAKKTYALLQTPEFVEEFILDQTMEPALEERPLEGFRLIDPTCGSGHFLLGAFDRLVTRWADHAPGINARQRVQNALDAVHGVDINPFAVAIARFRLIVAALQASQVRALEDAPAFTLHLATGDSLLHGQHQLTIDFEDRDVDSELSGFAYGTEDLAKLREILRVSTYDVVVGNPPYITVKDKKLNAAYRGLYTTCKGKYALTVPFMERFFQLAKRPPGDQLAGWVGQITSNSFMKREFGTKLIESFLCKQDLREVIDTSGAYIPGHGTPTIIVVGRSQRPQSSQVKAVLGVRGEPSQPAVPAKGHVWSSIVDHVDEQSFEDDYVTVTMLDRGTLARHPWSLSGGGADEVLDKISDHRGMLGKLCYRIGVFGIMGADDAMMLERGVAERTGREQIAMRELVVGENVRDFAIQSTEPTWFPYDRAHELQDICDRPGWARALWPLRTELGNRATFSGGTYFSDRRPYFEWHQLPKDTGANEWAITFAFVATHNHFVLDRGGKVFNRSAPVIKLPKEATEDDHLALLGVLNSTTACFWLKQKSHDKGNGGIGGGIASTEWERFYEFTGTTLKDFPLPKALPLERARTLDGLAQELAGVSPDHLTSQQVPTGEALAQSEKQATSLRQRMIAQQEELDWQVYRAYGILDDDLTYHGDDLPEIALGERAFEIALARAIAAGDEETAWFTRHGSTPITQIPEHWPADYRALVQRRLDLIASDRFIGLLEKPEHKRRWATEPWGTQVDRALRGWLLDRLEDRTFWFDSQGRPAPKSIAQLADQVSHDADLVSVLELWSGTKDQSVTTSLVALLADEAVSYLAAYRLKEPGMRKREEWERTWELQRREDAGEDVGDIPVPRKYTTADFRRQAWWHHRGKLDVPKERFIGYPDASRDTDTTMTIGWAGWDHFQQAIAIATLIGERQADGWADERLVPLVAGLAELQPWVRQWHDHMDEVYGVNLADFCAEQLRQRAAQVGRTIEDLHAWRPAPTRRGRRATA